jgi:L,D-transpeptidase ErfK/SrfK
MFDPFPSRRDVIAGLATTLAIPSLAAQAKKPKPARPVITYPDMVGEIRHHFATKEDTLLDLARTHKLGYVEMVAANRNLDPWVPGEGAEIVLPTAHLLPDGPREGVMLNLVDQRLYYFPADGRPVESYPIGTGQEAWETPLGRTKIVRKKKDPAWYPPKSIREEDPSLPRVVRPGPNNPLGQHAMYLGWNAYLIHGTNNPWGVGRRVSHGCVRMYPEDIKTLFSRIPIGAPVTVVSQEVKTGWHEGELMMEVHPNLNQNIELEERGRLTPAVVPELANRLTLEAGDQAQRINWTMVSEAVRDRSGIPVPILRDKTNGADKKKTASKI